MSSWILKKSVKCLTGNQLGKPRVQLELNKDLNLYTLNVVPLTNLFMNLPGAMLGRSEAFHYGVNLHTLQLHRVIKRSKKGFNRYFLIKY